MPDLKLFDAESKLMDLIWELEPINSTELTKVCRQKLGWEKSTTYTMIRRLSQRSIIKNANATVSAIVKREQIRKHESEALLRKSFDNSLPSFLATFLRDKQLTRKEAKEIRKMIEEVTE